MYKVSKSFRLMSLSRLRLLASSSSKPPPTYYLLPRHIVRNPNRSTRYYYSMPPPPPPTHILETCLYVRDITTSTAFYRDTLNLSPFLSTPRMAAFALGNTTLILFQLGLTAADTHPTEKDTIPGHGPSEDVISALKDSQGGLKQHYCLAVPSVKEVAEWEAHFAREGVTVLGTMDWEKGGRSVYFADPDGHVGEVGSRGIWAHY